MVVMVAAALHRLAWAASRASPSRPRESMGHCMSSVLSESAGERHCTDKLPSILTGSLLQQWQDATQGLEGQQK